MTNVTASRDSTGLGSFSSRAADAAHDAFGNVKQRAAMSARVHDDAHHLVERHEIRAADIVSPVAAAARHGERHARGEVVDQDRLDFLAAGARDAEDWSETERAGETVHDFVFRAVDQRRAEDSIGQARLANRALCAAFGAKGGMGAVLVGRGAADVDELFYAGLFRCAD